MGSQTGFTTEDAALELICRAIEETAILDSRYRLTAHVRYHTGRYEPAALVRIEGQQGMYPLTIGIVEVSDRAVYRLVSGGCPQSPPVAASVPIADPKLADKLRQAVIDDLASRRLIGYMAKYDCA